MFVAMGPYTFLKMMSLGQPIHRKPSLKFLALKRELILKVTAFPAKCCGISHFLFQLLCSPDNRKLARIVPVMITPRDDVSCR